MIETHDNRQEHTTRRVFAWGWGAALAAGGLMLTLGGGLSTAGIVSGIGATIPIFYGLAGAVIDDIKARGWGEYLRSDIRSLISSIVSFMYPIDSLVAMPLETATLQVCRSSALQVARHCLARIGRRVLIQMLE